MDVQLNRDVQISSVYVGFVGLFESQRFWVYNRVTEKLYMIDSYRKMRAWFDADHECSEWVVLENDEDGSPMFTRDWHPLPHYSEVVVSVE